MMSHIGDSLKAFGEKTADIFKKEDHSNEPTEEEQKQSVVDAIVEKQQKVAKEEDILSHKDQEALPEKYGDAQNKVHTITLFQFQKLADSADLEKDKERDEAAVAGLKKVISASLAKGDPI